MFLRVGAHPTLNTALESIRGVSREGDGILFQMWMAEGKKNEA